MKLICKTKFPEITVAGLGKFKAGDCIGDGTPFPVSDSLGGQLQQGGEWEFVGTDAGSKPDAEPAAFSTPHKRKTK